RAAPELVAGVQVGGFGDADDDPAVALDRPQHGAVGSAGGAEVGRRAVAPEGRVGHFVTVRIGEPGDPSPVVDAAPGTAGPTQRVELGDRVCGGRVQVLDRALAGPG